MEGVLFYQEHENQDKDEKKSEKKEWMEENRQNTDRTQDRKKKETRRKTLWQSDQTKKSLPKEKKVTFIRR